MAYRRSFSRTRSGGASSRFSRFRRRGRPLRIVRDSGHWEKCNMWFTTAFVVSPNPDETINFVVTLADITNLGVADGPGRAFKDMTRFLDVGGLVVHSDVKLMNQTIDYNAFGAPAANEFYVREAIIVDRQNNLGQPTGAINYAAQLAGTPMVQATAGLPASGASEDNQPTRVLWHRWNARFIPSLLTVQNPPEGELVFHQDSYYSQKRSTPLSKRIKVRLPDQHGLYFHYSFVKGPGFGGQGPVSCRLSIAGTLFYRVRL